LGVVSPIATVALGVDVVDVAAEGWILRADAVGELGAAGDVVADVVAGLAIGSSLAAPAQT
jgi:hypothetical protein